MRSLSKYPASISFASIALLLVLSWITTSTDARYETDSALEALEDFPDQIGDGAGLWIAVRDVGVPSRQERILDLSSHVSREFRRLGSHPPVTATLFIAYCLDARTMAGHPPPHCYPASGWSMKTDGTTRSTVVREDGRTIDCTVYQFRRDPINDVDLTVVNGFFAAPGTFSATLDEASEALGSVFFGRRGLFQFQILFQDLKPGVDVMLYAEELLRGIPGDVFDLAFGREDTEILVGGNGRGAES